MKIHKILNYLPFIFLSIFFIVNVFLFWPGQMNPDSHCQFNYALTGNYSDHHPPMMSFLWKLFNYICCGPELFFLFHLILLYSTAALFMITFRETKLIWLYLFLPLFPHIIFYSSAILKDVSFAFSYLLSMSILNFYVIRNKIPNFFSIFIVLLLLFYGTSVKYQGIFILPIVLLGLAYCINNFKFNYKTYALTILLFFSQFFTIETFNNYFVSGEQKSHSWQLVKLYDLAAISVYTDQALLPEFILNSPNFSMQKLKSRFNHEKVDDIAFPADSPIFKGKTEEQRQQVLDYWYKNIFKYPQIYFWHRFCNWLSMTNSIPLKRLETLDFKQMVSFFGFKGLSWLQNFNDIKESQNVSGFKNFIIYYFSTFIISLLFSIRYVLRFIFLFPFIIFYFFLGILNFNRSREAVMLTFINGVSITLLIILFFFSMAGVPRYAYIASCMTHACHGLAYLCLRRKNFISNIDTVK